MIRIFIRYLFIVCIVTGMFFLLFDKIVMPLYVSHSQSRYLPNVVGLPFEEARNRLEVEGFSVLKGDMKYTDQFLPGTVIDQYPKSFMRVKPGRRVRLTLSEREKMVMVPDVVGKSIRSAKLEIQESRLRIESELSEYDSEVPKNVIKWQHPRAGDYLRPGSGMTIIVSLGRPPDFYQVPQLFGLSLEQAKELLHREGLEVGRIYYRQNEDLLPNTVLEQSIEAETILDRPVPVDITVSILDLDDVYRSLMEKK